MFGTEKRVICSEKGGGRIKLADRTKRDGHKSGKSERNGVFKRTDVIVGEVRAINSKSGHQNVNEKRRSTWIILIHHLSKKTTEQGPSFIVTSTKTACLSRGVRVLQGARLLEKAN